MKKIIACWLMTGIVTMTGCLFSDTSTIYGEYLAHSDYIQNSVEAETSINSIYKQIDIQNIVTQFYDVWHSSQLWDLFRNDISFFLTGAYYARENGIQIIEIFSWKIIELSVFNPVLYLEVMNTLLQVSTQELTEGSFQMLNHLFSSIAHNFEHGGISLHDMRTNIANLPGADVYRPWQNYYDWEHVRNLYVYGTTDTEGVGSIPEWTRGVVRRVENSVRHEHEDIRLLYLLFELTTAYIWCPLWLIALFAEDVRAIVLDDLVNLIISLREGGFVERYQDYIDMIMHPNRAFDPWTREIQETFYQMLTRRMCVQPIKGMC